MPDQTTIETDPAPSDKGAVRDRPPAPCSAWIDAEKFLPMGPHEVLATDGEAWFVACLQGSEWWLHEIDEPCDSQVTHWMELPELPELPEI